MERDSIRHASANRRENRRPCWQKVGRTMHKTVPRIGLQIAVGFKVGLCGKESAYMTAFPFVVAKSNMTCRIESDSAVIKPQSTPDLIAKDHTSTAPLLRKVHTRTNGIGQ